MATLTNEPPEPAPEVVVLRLTKDEAQAAYNRISAGELLPRYTPLYRVFEAFWKAGYRTKDV